MVLMYFISFIYRYESLRWQIEDRKKMQRSACGCLARTNRARIVCEWRMRRARRARDAC